MFYDTHVHFDGVPDTDACVARAVAAGVSRLLAVGGHPRANETALAVAQRYPDHVRCALGYDRDTADRAVSLSDLASLLREPAVAAVGEIGLDYHHAGETAASQRKRLAQMLALAVDRDLPVVLHCRRAAADTLAALREFEPGRLRGVLHCFTEDAALAAALTEQGFHISFSGIVTFRNAGDLRQVAAGVPADRLLIETDTPYLAPEPHRGHPNQPAWVVHVAETLARVRACSIETVAACTSRNAAALFG